MELITRAQIVALLNNTFMDNEEGLIDPSAQRVFNNKSFDFMIGLVATFVIDSDDALAAWANNTEGNDYTHVLIRAGEWTSDVEVNLTTAGTKAVVGMPGSLLKFVSSCGLKYDDFPSSPEYWMRGVNIDATLYKEEGDGLCTCLNSCINLKNCYGKANGDTGFAFTHCDNFVDCHGLGISDKAGVGFALCNKLINCAGSGIGSEKGVGFYGCGMMMFNEPASTPSTMGTYMNCYMEYTKFNNVGDKYTPVSYSAEGGWNRGEIVE